MNSDLLKYCRYYKGEKKCPYSGNEEQLWFYEKAWLNDCQYRMMDERILDYINAGLNGFKSTDGVPITLKAYLFVSLGKGAYSLYEFADEFKKIYMKYYG